PGTYTFSIGTAGSASLVLQAVLPALAVAKAPSIVTVEGGTHNPGAPPFDFLQRAFLPLLDRIGIEVTAELDRYGFYPAGGGSFTVHVTPSSRMTSLSLLDRGAERRRRARAIVAGLPS